MITPSMPNQEMKRLKELHNFDILDTLPEAEYDAITRIASEICQTPISLISLIDDNRQWFKSKQGLDVAETHRDLSFCGHAINTPDVPFVVNDANQDKRFADNPLVTGEPHVIFYAGIPLVTSEGNALGTLCVIDDHPRSISKKQLENLKALANQVNQLLELRKSIRLLEQKQEQLEHAYENLEQFCTIVSHDVKMPLKNVEIYTELLNRKLGKADPKEIQKIIDTITYSSKEGINLVNGVFKYSKSINSLKSNFEDIYVSEIIESVLQQIPVPRNIKIEYPKNIPPIHSSKIAFYQIFLNLISNAIKYNDKPKGEITISFKEKKSKYQFSITDNGIGIDKKYAKKIFNLFYRVDESLEEKEGNGVGLAIVKKLVTQLNGDVKIKSVVGEYCTFIFSIEHI